MVTRSIKNPTVEKVQRSLSELATLRVAFSASRHRYREDLMMPNEDGSVDIVPMREWAERMARVTQKEDDR